MYRTITEGSVDLDKFPASRFWQMAKKFKSSKATVHHIEQVAGDLQATQINLMRHQRTEVPTNRHNKKRRPTGKQKLYETPESPVTNQVKKPYDSRKTHKMPHCCNKCGDFINAQGFQCPAKKYQCKVCNKYGHFSSLCYQKKTQFHPKNNCRNPKAHQLHCRSNVCTGQFQSQSFRRFKLWWVIFPTVQIQSNHAEGKQIPSPVHLIMTLAYWLKPHHTRNMYLWAWLDTCADMNIMPASVYQLVFKDPEMRKNKPCKMQISTYTADTVKIIWSCTFGIVHPDTKKLVPVTFYVANNDGSILLSCKMTLALHLIQPQSRWDYLPPWASLITSTMDQPKKTKLTSLKVHRSNKKYLLKGKNHKAMLWHPCLQTQYKNQIQTSW